MIARLKRFQCWAQAFIARTPAPAVTRPSGVSATTGVPAPKRETGVRS